MVTNVGGSGKFKKMMANRILTSRGNLQRKKEPKLSFSRNYLDSTVSKLLVSDRRNNILSWWYHQTITPGRRKYKRECYERLESLRRNCPGSLGIPEFADVIGGQMFAGDMSATTTCCLTQDWPTTWITSQDQELVTCFQRCLSLAEWCL